MKEVVASSIIIVASGIVRKIVLQGRSRQLLCEEVDLVQEEYLKEWTSVDVHTEEQNSTNN